MKCEFCHQPCRLSHKENEDRNDKNKYIEVYDCVSCPVLTSFYVNHEDGSTIKTVFMLDRNEKVYMWTNHYLKKISYITDVGVTLAREGKDPLILKFPKIMPLTPENVHDKFKFYMIFL